MSSLDYDTSWHFHGISLGVAAWLLKQAGALRVEPVKRQQKSNQHREEDQPYKQPQHTVAPRSPICFRRGIMQTLW